MITYLDEENKFAELFNPKTGFYVRSGVIKNGKDTNIDPFMRNYPQLIDVGIMGHCRHGKSGLCRKSGIQCYQNGMFEETPNMSLENFKKIVRQCRGKVFQFALGGRGDVDEHEEFGEILRLCRENGIVPNFTTSGFNMTLDKAKTCKEYAGAVAVSWYRAGYSEQAIELLLKADVKTNVHYVLGNNTIDEATDKLIKQGFPQKINAVIFLLHKPVGMGERKNVLKVNDFRVRRFFDIINNNTFKFKIGFDSCSCAGIVNLAPNINRNSIDYCEGARFSCYIDAQMNMMPCSFAHDNPGWHVNLYDCTVKEAWNSLSFSAFRKHLQNACPECKDREYCGGGCPLVNEITLCERAEREEVKS